MGCGPGPHIPAVLANSLLEIAARFIGFTVIFIVVLGLGMALLILHLVVSEVVGEAYGTWAGLIHYFGYIALLIAVFVLGQWVGW